MAVDPLLDRVRGMLARMEAEGIAALPESTLRILLRDIERRIIGMGAAERSSDPNGVRAVLGIPKES